MNCFICGQKKSEKQLQDIAGRPVCRFCASMPTTPWWSLEREVVGFIAFDSMARAGKSIAGR